MSILNNIKNFEDSEFQDWIWRFEKATAAMGRSKDEDMISHLPVFLEGIALKFFRALPLEIQGSYPKSKEHLKTRFSPSVGKSSMDLENYRNFGYNIKKLVDLAFRLFDGKDKDCLYLTNFLKKIDPVQAEVIATHDSVKTIDQAIALCKKIVDAKEMYGAKSCNTVDASLEITKELKKEIQSLTDKVNAILLEKKSEPCYAAVPKQ
ncbi:hypothetical protein RF11_13730 [Thelohanellus kitauei]|uniref:Uncharacterized protein n=1 Tax=Thelohanellus kitauei TaxID=669202 RepID=A0A0C2J4D2_THEKT|nr:hypothetical protein RF11_13730 [Thelohanellus kitauei]